MSLIGVCCGADALGSGMGGGHASPPATAAGAVDVGAALAALMVEGGERRAGVKWRVGRGCVAAEAITTGESELCAAGCGETPALTPGATGEAAEGEV